MKRGFTLTEVLIVVFITGILASVAVPLYQGALDKGRWANLLNPSRSIVNAQEAIYLSQGSYTSDPEILAVSLPTDEQYNYQLYTVANGDAANLVRLTSDKLADVRLARYYSRNGLYADALLCEAKTTNKRANKLCGKLLKGEELLGEEEGYKSYLISGKLDIASRCSTSGGYWSNNFSTCYQTERERCEANNMPYNITTGLCGWLNSDNVRIGEGATCRANRGTNTGCYYVTIDAGGTCEGNAVHSCKNNMTVNVGGTCIGNNMWTCGGGNYYGGTCIGNADGSCTSMTTANPTHYREGSTCIGNVSGACAHSTITFHEGSKCVANAEGACTGVTYEAGSCCEGNFCPESAPAC